MSLKKAAKSSAVANMENMGIYFEEEKKQKRWESGQAILHQETREFGQAGKKKNAKETYGVKNSYGTLRYLKKEEAQGQEKEGLALEALEAPGTPLHTEKEKHLDRSTMKRIKHTGKQSLYASEIPLHNQALFYDTADSKKSERFLKCMKHLIRRQGHQTLRDTFGFLDQDPERIELEYLKQELYQPANDTQPTAASQRMDTLNSRLLRKEAKERQLLGDLQLMLNQREKETQSQSRQGHAPEKEAQQQNGKKEKQNDNIRRRILPPGGESMEATAGQAEEDESSDTDSK